MSNCLIILQSFSPNIAMKPVYLGKEEVLLYMLFESYGGTWYTESLFHFLYILTLSQCHIKGELQRQNKLISSRRPFKILQNETKIVKIRKAVLEIFNFKDLDLDSFPRKND